MDGGLNDGFALEEHASETPQEPKVKILTDDNFDGVVFDDPTPGVDPEIKENLNIIFQLKDKVGDLDYLRHDVEKAGGMSSGFSLEAAALIPNFFNDDRLPSYFTQGISQTQYKATLESIDGEKVSIISQIINRIKEIIAKFVQLIKGLFDKIRNRGGAEGLYVYENMGKKEVTGPLSKLSETVADAVAQMQTLKTRVKSSFSEIEADEFFTQLEARFTQTQTQLQQLYASVNSSKLTRSVVFAPETLNLCFIAASEEKRTLEAFKAVYDFAIDLGNGKQRSVISDTTPESVQVFYERATLRVVDKIKIGNTGLSPSEALEKVKNSLEEVADQTVDPKQINFFKLVNYFSNLFSAEKVKHVLTDMNLSQGSGSHDDFVTFQKMLSNVDMRLTGNPQEVSIAGKLLAKLAKEFNDHFALRLHYGNLLNSYLMIGHTANVLLKKYNRDIFIATATMDEKFQNFIRSHFSDGSPDFFTPPKTE